MRWITYYVMLPLVWDLSPQALAKGQLSGGTNGDSGEWWETWQPGPDGSFVPRQQGTFNQPRTNPSNPLVTSDIISDQREGSADWNGGGGWDSFPRTQGGGWGATDNFGGALPPQQGGAAFGGATVHEGSGGLPNPDDEDAYWGSIYDQGGVGKPVNRWQGANQYPDRNRGGIVEGSGRPAPTPPHMRPPSEPQRPGADFYPPGGQHPVPGSGSGVDGELWPQPTPWMVPEFRPATTTTTDRPPSLGWVPQTEPPAPAPSWLAPTTSTSASLSPAWLTTAAPATSSVPGGWWHEGETSAKSTALPPTYTVPVVVVSSSADREDTSDIYEVGTTHGNLLDTPFAAILEPLMKPGILAAVIGGAVVGLLAAVLLVMFIVYRMRKKDEGSYALDEPKSPPLYPYAYQKAPAQEFYA